MKLTELKDKLKKEEYLEYLEYFKLLNYAFKNNFYFSKNSFAQFLTRFLNHQMIFDEKKDLYFKLIKGLVITPEKFLYNEDILQYIHGPFLYIALKKFEFLPESSEEYKKLSKLLNKIFTLNKKTINYLKYDGYYPDKIYNEIINKNSA